MLLGLTQVLFQLLKSNKIEIIISFNITLFVFAFDNDRTIISKFCLMLRINICTCNIIRNIYENI